VKAAATLPTAVQRLTTVDQVDALLRDSTAQPVLIFKHSLTCGTSAYALDELADHLEHGDGPHAHYAVVTVQTHREVSTAISTRLGIRHETPQALLIMDGRVVWSASHFRVTAESIATAIQGHRASQSRP
jgi:bacillithiol system protein YtxJ